MKQVILTVLIVLTVIVSKAQLSPPKTEGLFGGSILDITGYAKSSDTTVIFVSTESPNSVFKSKIKTTPLGLLADSFEVLPSLSASKGFGSNLNSLAYDAINKYLFFGHQSGLYYTTEIATIPVKIDNFSTQTVFIKDSVLLYFQNNLLNYKKIRIGNIINSGFSGYNLPGTANNFSIAINPVNQFVYVLSKGNTPVLYKSSVPYFNLTSTSNFLPVSISGSWPGVLWEGVGIGPDGRIFIGGADNTGKKVLYSDNEISWNFVNTSIAGKGISKFAFSGNSTSYVTHYSTAVSLNKGLNWKGLGSVFQETHPNDGNVFVSPVAQNCIFFNTDAGLGASANNGDSIFDINNGIEALQINGLDMNLSKTGAWIASKAGLKKITNYQSSQKKWSKSMFPNGDGSPYYSVALVSNDTNRVYAGNIRIYKSNDGGKIWSQVFSPEGPPYNFPSFNLKVTKIAICPFDTNLILASYAAELPTKGGLFYSLNAGNTWTQLRIASTSIGQDININDIVITKETSDTIAYVALNYDSTNPLFNNVFRLTKRGNGWLVNQNMDAPNMASGIGSLAQIEDLELNLNADTLFASGINFEGSSAQYQIYFKAFNFLNKWELLKMNGFPSYFGSKIKIALGKDTLYAAVKEDLIVFPIKDSVWFRAYQYQVGSIINFLYYDELLAGTGVGLYGHLGTPAECRPKINNFNPSICYNEFIDLPDSNKVNTSGRYQFLYKSKNGCDSIVTITLTVNRPDVSISVRQDTLISNEINATQYQWLNCNTGYSIVPDAVTRDFKPNQSGNYAVKVTKAFCTDTSACFFVQANGLEIKIRKELKVFPNPCIEFFQIEGDQVSNFDLLVLDILGNTLLKQNIIPAEKPKISISQLPAGIYLIRLTAKDVSEKTIWNARLLVLDQH